MPLRVFVILPFEGQVPAEIFNGGRWVSHGFLPRIERFLQPIQVFGVKLRLRKFLPGVGIIWRDGDDAAAQFDNCRLVGSVFGRFQLDAQLPKFRSFCLHETGAPIQCKNSDYQRSQFSARSWAEPRRASSIFLLVACWSRREGRTDPTALTAKVTQLLRWAFALRRFAEKFCRSGITGKLRTDCNLVCAQNNVDVRAR